MRTKFLVKAVFSDAGLIFCAGAVFVLVGYDIYSSGLIRNTFSVGSAKLPVALVFSIFGLVAAYFGVKAVVTNYKRLRAATPDE